MLALGLFAFCFLTKNTLQHFTHNNTKNRGHQASSPVARLLSAQSDQIFLELKSLVSFKLMRGLFSRLNKTLIRLIPSFPFRAPSQVPVLNVVGMKTHDTATSTWLF